MRVTIHAVGRLKSGPERDLSARYFDRFSKIGPQQGLELGRIIEVPESRASDTQTRQREEAAALDKSLPPDALLLLLDETGKSVDSEHFANQLGQWRDSGKRDLMIAIGGADGHHNSLHKRADHILNFGKMTWPHQIVRILLAEQLYRAATILSGHPYHRS